LRAWAPQLDLAPAELIWGPCRPTQRPAPKQRNLDLLDTAQGALAALLSDLQALGYRFVPPTPATHARILARPDRQVARSLRDVFGWSLPFAPDLLPPAMFAALEAGGGLARQGDLFKSRLRIASLDGRLFLHSAYPTSEEQSVFLGPDSYRFVAFVQNEVDREGVRSIVDIGAGSGVGGLMAAGLVPGAEVTLIDANPEALRLAAVNAQHAGIDAVLIEGCGTQDVPDGADLVLANPPYMMDEDGRTYRDGGDMNGARISFDWTIAAAAKLAPGGRVLLYTGVAIVDGRDELREKLEAQLPELGCTLRYRELDPDVFGEELEKAPYAQVERIAAIGAVVERVR
jgi:methylase of polypeptide subunit release factors